MKIYFMRIFKMYKITTLFLHFLQYARTSSVFVFYINMF